ncbi:hypothetical protein RhiirA1_482796 [Rhizophagus irregularis]|uniref:Uncharacterized protein n=1 Tax=Rhizophagus irregularis TaxID=588596 RepID=A0A2I1FPH8_9GLOM|nr:hypothetical protein RhiirA1_482796 [Rhizophagus irregularis]PKY36258.1 hypothetical protein RhiirB3_458466 [Rhizophagus irregularis]
MLHRHCHEEFLKKDKSLNYNKEQDKRKHSNACCYNELFTSFLLPKWTLSSYNRRLIDSVQSAINLNTQETEKIKQFKQANESEPNSNYDSNVLSSLSFYNNASVLL